jgi:hypothetical protein
MRRFLARFLLFAALTLLIAELVFRTVIPAASQGTSEQDPETLLMRYNPRVNRDGVRTVGRLGQVACHWHINDAGWNSPVEYELPGATRGPLLAIIGDSDIEGFRVGADDNVCAVLRRRLPSPWQVYSFGQPGSSLAHSLYVARYVTRFQPAAILILVAQDDLCGSLPQYGENVFNLQLTSQGDSLIEVPPTGRYHPNRISRMMRHSAMLRYLFFNVEFDLRHALQKPLEPIAAPTNPEAALEREHLERAVARYVVEHMEREHPAMPVYYIVDAPRSAIYEGKPEHSRREAAYLWEACAERRNSHVLDLGPLLAADWNLHHQRFDYQDDEHWNARAHGLCARVVADSLQATFATIPSTAALTDDEDSH